MKSFKEIQKHKQKKKAMEEIEVWKKEIKTKRE
jgi:hypothetical protein